MANATFSSPLQGVTVDAVAGERKTILAAAVAGGA
jgi:hypothetical protein